MTHGSGAAVEVPAPAGLSLAAKGNADTIPRGNAGTATVPTRCVHGGQPPLRVPSDKERNSLGVGIETKMRWCTRVQGRFTELSHAEPRCWYARQVRRQTAHPSRPARWNSSPEIDGSWRDIRSILGRISSSRNSRFPQSANRDFGCKLPNVGQLLVKNPYIVLSQKEQELARVRREIQALLTAIPLLLADDQYSADNVSQELFLAVSRNDLEPFVRHLRNSSSQKR